MALSAYVGSLAQPAATGNQSYTGVGFKPLVVIFFGTNVTADGNGTNTATMMGAAVSSSMRRAGWVTQNDGVTGGANNSMSSWRDDFCIRVTAVTATTTLAAADHVTMDTDGFTLNWTTTDGTARLVSYIALGGTDLTNAFLGTLTPAATTGNQAFTGVGFKPDAVMFFAQNKATPIPGEVLGGNSVGMIGFGVSATSRASTAYRNSSTSPSQAGSSSRSNQVFVRMSTNTAVSAAADFVSMDSDGFTLNFATSASTNQCHMYLALKGVRAKAGVFNQATGTGNQATTGIGFNPTALLLSSWDVAASTTKGPPSRISFGAGVSASQRACMWSGYQDNNANPLAKNNLDRANIIKMMTEAAPPTTEAAADLVSFDADGWTLNWTTADGTAREVAYLAIGSVTVPGGKIYKQAVNRASTY